MVANNGEFNFNRPLGDLLRGPPARRVELITLELYEPRPQLQRQNAVIERPGALEVLADLIAQGIAQQQNLLQRLEVLQQRQEQQQQQEQRQQCLQEWLWNSPTCPLCRQSAAPLN